MSRLCGLGLATLALLSFLNPNPDRFAKYKTIEAYEIRPGILMMPRYSADGQVCEIGLQKLHYTKEKIRLDSGLEHKEINEIFDELVPASERGTESKAFEGSVITRDGASLVTTIDFENVSIQIYGQASPAAGEGGTIVDEVAAALRWKNRRCR